MTCCIKQCDRPVCLKSFCRLHYERVRAHGDPMINKNRLHMMSKTPEYTAYHNMKGRCLNPALPEYKHYGGRGIRVCNRWLENFSNFLEDMGRKPAPEYTLDRIDVNGDYSPENCRWATRSIQSLNRRPIGTTGHKNIYPSGAGFMVSVNRKYLGSYKTVESAIQVRDNYLKELQI